jgi:hypothetical protein
MMLTYLAKFFSAFAKGATYATVLKTKMQNVEAASQSINDEAGLGQHTRLSEIRNLSWLSTTLFASDKRDVPT